MTPVGHLFTGHSVYSNDKYIRRFLINFCIIPNRDLNNNAYLRSSLYYIECHSSGFQKSCIGVCVLLKPKKYVEQYGIMIYAANKILISVFVLMGE